MGSDVLTAGGARAGNRGNTEGDSSRIEFHSEDDNGKSQEEHRQEVARQEVDCGQEVDCSQEHDQEDDREEVHGQEVTGQEVGREAGEARRQASDSGRQEVTGQEVHCA